MDLLCHSFEKGGEEMEMRVYKINQVRDRDQFTGCYKHDDETSFAMIGEEFLEWVSSSFLLKMGSVPWL
jgi:hypothetical protein